MTVKGLIERLQHLLATGEIDPEAIVVRPFCMCDEEGGYVEAKFVDQVVRRRELVQGPESNAIYRHGNVAPDVNTAVTVKLG